MMKQLQLQVLSEQASEAESDLLEYADSLRHAAVTALELPSLAAPYFQKAEQLRRRIVGRAAAWERALEAAWRESPMQHEPMPADPSVALERLVEIGGPMAARLQDQSSRIEALVEAVAELEAAAAVELAARDLVSGG